MENESTINPIWHIHDELSVNQAAALLSGYDPEVVSAYQGPSYHEQFKGYSAARHAIINAINSGRLKAKLRFHARIRGFVEMPDVGEIVKPRHRYDPSEFPDEIIFTDTPSWEITTISIDDLKIWLIQRGVKSGFFFPNTQDTPGFLDKSHPRYAPKLAASLSAWLATTDTVGKHPKQALAKWLNENAAEFGLTNDDGEPVKQSIEECAKVANWQPGGGAPTTPGE